LKFDASGTRRTAAQVLLGTIGGFVVGVAILFAAGTHGSVYLALLPVVVFVAAYTPGRTTLAIGQGAFTVYLIVLMGVQEPGQFGTSEVRVIDIAMGLSVSLVVSAMIWPRGITPLVFSSLRNGAGAATDYVAASFGFLVGQVSDQQLQVKRKYAETQVAIANDTFDLTYAQSAPGLGDPRVWTVVANTATHMVFAAEVLSTLATALPLPVDSDRSKAALMSMAEQVGVVATAATESLADEAVQTNASWWWDHERESWSPNDDLVRQRLRETVRHDIAQASSTPKPGDQAMALVFASGWSVQMLWLAQRLQAMTSTHAASTEATVEAAL